MSLGKDGVTSQVIGLFYDKGDYMWCKWLNCHVKFSGRMSSGRKRPKFY